MIFFFCFFVMRAMDISISYNTTTFFIQVNLSISGGSCFLEASVNASQVLEVVQPPTGLQCLQLVLSPKGLGTALVTVHDIGLAPPTTASAVVRNLKRLM